ncbi:MAG: hypothetical protein WAU32_05835 [Thermoanaerobaculia bacterium]
MRQRDLGAVNDSKALLKLRKRLAELTREIDEEKDVGHAERAEVLREEKDQVLEQLKASVGKAGRKRRLSDTSERPRKAVFIAIRRAILALRGRDSRLTAHLRGSIKTGFVCRYEPGEQAAWTVRVLSP